MDPYSQGYYQQGYQPPQGAPYDNAPPLPNAASQPGYPYYPPQQPYSAYPYIYSPQQESARNKATAAMILGILSFLVVPVILAIIALVMGNGAKKVLAPGVPGYSQAQAGVVLGIINLCVYGFIIIIPLFMLFRLI
jgi:hypothetical protein